MFTAYHLDRFIFRIYVVERKIKPYIENNGCEFLSIKRVNWKNTHFNTDYTFYFNRFIYFYNIEIKCIRDERKTISLKLFNLMNLTTKLEFKPHFSP